MNRSCAAALLALVLAGCATTREEPEPRVETQQVFIEVPVTCVPDNLGDEPSYPDTNEALAAAEDFAERYNLLWAGRLLREARAGEVEPVITKCREAASE